MSIHQLTRSASSSHIRVPVRPRPLLPYGVALLSVVVATLLRLALEAFGVRLPFLTFFLATIISAWLGGVGPGALALGLSLAANAALFGASDRTRTAAFLVVCTVIVLLYGSLRAAKGRAERARESELEARRAAEAARERASFLADGNVLLTASLDYDQTLSTVAGLLVPRLADWCAVDVVEPDGTIRRSAVANRDPALARATSVYPPDPDGRHPRTAVIRTGRSQLFAEVTDEGLVSIAANAEHLRVMREMGYASAIIVPLVARGRTLGAITCATMESRLHYTTDDLALVENLAVRAALALDNARLYRAAEAARAEAEEANRVKDEFLSVVSHELKTPLASTLGWLRVARTGKGNQARAFDTMERSMRAQAKLIEDLLDVSRIVAGRLRLDPRPIELARVVEAAVDTIRPESEAKGVRLDVRVTPPTGPVVGDADRLQQIVWNLVSNAVKFTPPGGRVGVRLHQVGSYAELVVEDTGKGVTKEFLPFMFERFRQADPVTSRDKGGLGLGLAITRHLVGLHGGRITVASDGPGKGTTFTVVLPVSSLAATGSS